MTIFGTSGDDNLNGTSAGDVFNMTQGGNDTVNGFGGGDTFNFGSTFTSADQVNGGGGTDTLKLNGGVTVAFQATTLVNVERILLASGHNYNLQLDDGNVAAGQTLTVDASALGSGNTLTLYDPGESDGNLDITGGAGADVIEGGLYHTVINGGDGNDTIFLFGGTNIVNGGAGNDIIRLDAPIAANSRFDGGAGSNQIFLNADFSAGQTIGAHWGTNIADFGLGGGHSYKLMLQNGFVAAGQTQYFYGNTLLASDTVSINASKLTAGNIYFQGGAGNDTFTGGAGNDIFEGRQGADKMTGGAGADGFWFNGVADSTGPAFDRITDFDCASDHLHVSVANIDPAVTTGALSMTNFDTKLAAAIGSSQLQAGDAVLFTPSSGTLAGHLILIVDANGQAGYQAGADYVLDLTGMTGTLTTGDFG